MPPRKNDFRQHRLITPTVLAQEVRTLLTEETLTDEALKRCVSRLNKWIAASPGDDTDLQPLEML